MRRSATEGDEGLGDVPRAADLEDVLPEALRQRRVEQPTFLKGRKRIGSRRC